MWSTIRSVSARQLRLAGIRSAGRAVWQLSRRPSAATPTGFRTSTSRGRIVLFQRGFATATKEPKKTTTTTKKPAAKKPAAKKPGKKKPAAKKAPAKKKPVKKPKKVLTDAEKQKLKIRELKVKSLVREEPKRLPVTPLSLYFSDLAKEKRGQGMKVQDILREAAANFKAFSPAQVQHYFDLRDKNKAINATAVRNFVLTKSVEEIAVANRARKELRALGFTAPGLLDERRPKGPSTAFALFNAEYWKKGDLVGLPIGEAAQKVASEWKALSASEKQIYEEKAAIDKERYVQEREAIGWVVKSSPKSP
ncbi:hypothetical protein OQA88_6757 [Cercophora sp. LCS_1]